MKASLNWLSDYVELPATPEETATRLTMAGLEIEGVHSPGAALAGVVVAQIVESVQHPNADKLSVTQIDAGTGEKLQVVCGAKNFKVGDKVPLATVGASLPNGMNITKAALRGVDSSGMLCSAKELGLSADAAGLLILDPSLAVGTPIAQALGLDDVVFEINVTPNRPDALSHLGVARELAALTGHPLRPPESKTKEKNEGPNTAAGISIRIDDPKGCPRYVARIVEGVKVGPSPQWLARRLEACGVRSINNIVDVTNYVLLEYGQPLHAFDLDQLAGPDIVVRRAKAGETLVTLDGKERALDADDLVIADREKAQAIAGVMGGGKSEVGEETTRVLLESAFFQPATVRRSSKRHGLHTEASHRFERGIDVTQVANAADRAAALIAELGGGTLRHTRLDVYPGETPLRRVALRFDRVSEVLGTEVKAEETRRILHALGYRGEEQTPQGATYVIPGHRVDVSIEEDLIEEVARVRGYDTIPAVLPKGVGESAPEPKSLVVERRLRTALSGLGFDEVVSYSFVAPSELEGLGAPMPAVTLINPLSVEQSAMRTSIFTGVLQSVARSVRHQAESLRLYELAREYYPDAEGGRGTRPVTREVLKVGAALWGNRTRRTWTAKDVAVDFYDAKGAVESILASLGITRGVTFVPTEAMPYHPRAAAEIRSEQGVVLGRVGEVHPLTVKRLDLPKGIFVFELELEGLEAAAIPVPQYTSLPRHPAVLRDLAVVVELARTSEEIRTLIREVGGEWVEDVSVFDVYTGKPIPEGQKNLAFAIRYRSADRTLTDAEVTGAHEKIVSEVRQRLGASLRA